MRLCDVNAVQALLGFYIDGVSFFRRLVGSERVHLAFDRQCCTPTAAILGNTNVAGAGPRFAAIANVFGSRHNAQVAQSVVVADAIDVVDLAIRFSAVGVEPRKSVQSVILVGDLGSQVPGPVGGANHIANLYGANRADTPSKDASLWVVVKKFAQAFCGKIAGTHAVAPVKQWFVERPVSVSALCGLRYFSMGVK